MIKVSHLHCIVNQSFFLKVRLFQNESMKSSFLPKYKRKIVRSSALCSKGRNLDNFFICILGETMTT